MFKRAARQIAEGRFISDRCYTFEDGRLVVLRYVEGESGFYSVTYWTDTSKPLGLAMRCGCKAGKRGLFCVHALRTAIKEGELHVTWTQLREAGA